MPTKEIPRLRPATTADAAPLAELIPAGWPATPADAAGLLLTAAVDPDPVIFLEPIRSYRRVRGEVADPPQPVPFGVVATVRAGIDVTMIAYGAMLPDVLDAAELLSDRGIEAEVLDLRTLVPLDADAVIESVARTGRVASERNQPACTVTVCGTSMKFSMQLVTPLSKGVTM